MSGRTIFIVALTALLYLTGCKPTSRPPGQDQSSSAETADKDKPAAETQERTQTVMPSPQIVDIPAPPDVASPPGGAEKTSSGLASKVLTPGTGTRHPVAESLVEVHYTGWTTDGKMFDSSLKRGRPAQFPLNRVIAGWTEGVQLMVEGEKRRLWIPEQLAYQGRPGAPQGMLVFDVELLRILR